ncbi:MAG: nitroreductase family protein [Bacteroidales bacterium]|nr:nitroreductase family protein [Bacteroidales bacterium]
MRIKSFLLIFAFVLVSGLSVAQTEMNQTLETIFNRSSIRSYSDKQVEKDQIMTLLKAGMSAPSAVNKQPWEFIVIDDKDLMGKIGDEFKNAGMIKKASCAIIVCGDLKLALEGVAQEFWVQDCSAATENILLAAHSLGLGAVWCGVYPNKERAKSLKTILSLPENIVPLNIIPIGVREKEQEPKDKWKEEKIHWNKW